MTVELLERAAEKSSKCACLDCRLACHYDRVTEIVYGIACSIKTVSLQWYAQCPVTLQ